MASPPRATFVPERAENCGHQRSLTDIANSFRSGQGWLTRCVKHTSKQRVAGSNPAGRATTKSQLKAYIAELTGNAHDALPRRRARCVPDGLVSDRPISAAARLLSASAMICCRSSLPCR